MSKHLKKKKVNIGLQHFFHSLIGGDLFPLLFVFIRELSPPAPRDVTSLNLGGCERLPSEHFLSVMFL